MIFAAILSLTSLPSQKGITYEVVAPIINEHCVSCHRPGDVGPFSLIGYENAKKYSSMISDSTEAKRMPPWKAVHGYGEFLDENVLTADKKELLKKWHEGGAKRGDKSKEPKPPKFPATEWILGKPDVILSSKKPYKLDSEGDDVYRNFVFDLGNTEPVYVTAMDVLPGNRKVVHHVIAFLDAQGQSVKREQRNTDGQEGYSTTGGGIGFMPSGALGGWAPGVRPRHTGQGMAFVVQPGTKIVAQVHYHKSGKSEVDQTKLGLYVTKEKPKQTADIYWAANPMFRIPAGAENHKVAWTETVPTDATIYTVMPHMHLLGKSMKAKVIMEDGKEIPLVFVDKWDFNWQLVYALKEPLFVKRGTKISVEAYYDNSTKNLNNPNATPKAVTWGEQTTDEMALLVVGYAAGKPITLQDTVIQKGKDFLKNRRNGQKGGQR
jgi:hypothetical protein